MGIIGNWLESLDYQYKVSDRCIREVSPRSSCRSCADICPSDALEMAKGRPVLDTLKCAECGLCLGACPVQAVEGIVPKRLVSGKKLVIRPGEEVSLNELLVHSSKGITGVLAANGELSAEWGRLVEKANKILAELGKEPFTAEASPQLEEKDEAFTRRQLFTMWGQEGKSLAKQAVPASWRFNQQALDVSKVYPEHQFYEIMLDPATCTLCKVCESTCPKKCFSLEDGQFTISPLSCTGCSLCEDVCPERAVSITEVVKFAETSEYGVTEKQCDSCKRPFQTLRPDEQACPTCAKRREGYLSSHVC